MRPLQILLVVLVLGVLLSVAWFVVGDSGRSQPAAASSATPARPVDAKHEEPSAPESAVAATPLAPDRVATEAAPAHAAAKESARPAHAGVALTGVVHDSDGKPVAGASIYAGNSGDGFLGSVPLDLPTTGRMSWLERSTGKTGADGRFELAGVKPGPTRLAVRASGFAPQDVGGIDVPAGQSHDVGTIELAPSVIVDGRVVDARGRGVAGAKIERVNEPAAGAVMFFQGSRQPGVEVATSRADGSFTVDQLAAGVFKLRATTEDHPDKLESGSASRPGERVTMNIALDDGYEIAGRVVGVPAERQDGLRVRASPSRGEADNADYEFDMPFEGGETREALAKSDGTFVVRGLRENKSYALRARGPDSDNDPFSPSLSARVVARAGDRGVELPYQPEAALVFTVVDARTRAPIEEYDVQAGIDWRMPLPNEDGERAKLHPGGETRFGGLRPKKPTDKASLEIQAVGYRKLEMEDIALAAGRDTNLGMLALEPVPVTRITVLDDATGEPLAGARVTLRKAPEPVANAGFSGGRQVAIRAARSAGDEADDINFGDSDERVSGRTDAKGLAILTSFEGARSLIETHHADHAPYRSEEFTAAIGAPEERTVRMRHGGSVRVTLKNGDGTPVAGGRVDHQRSDDDEWFVPPGSENVTSSEGVVVFEHLAEGPHRFRPHGGGDGTFGDGNFAIAVRGMEDSDSDGGWSEAVVTEGVVSALTLIAPARVTLSGRVREAGENLSGATVSIAPRNQDGTPGMRMPMLMGGGPSAKTDGSGRYTLEDVKAGDYTLTVSHPTRQMPTELELTIGEADKTFDVELSLAIVEGRVTAPDGKPVAGVRVTAERDQGGASRPQVVRMIAFRSDSGDSMTLGGEEGGTKAVMTDAEGRYALRGVLTGVKLVVRGEATGCQPAKSEAFEVAENQVKRGVDLELARAGKIEVSAFKHDGSPASMVLLSARPESEELRSQEPKTAFIQENGKGVLEGLAPGKWRVSARQLGPNSGGRGQSPTVEPQVIEVKADETVTARFDLP